MNSLYADGTRECVSDQDTMNIYGISSPRMRVYQTACTPGMLYRNWPPELANSGGQLRYNMPGVHAVWYTRMRGEDIP